MSISCCCLRAPQYHKKVLIYMAYRGPKSYEIHHRNRYNYSCIPHIPYSYGTLKLRKSNKCTPKTIIVIEIIIITIIILFACCIFMHIYQYTQTDSLEPEHVFQYTRFFFFLSFSLTLQWSVIFFLCAHSYAMIRWWLLHVVLRG